MRRSPDGEIPMTRWIWLVAPLAILCTLLTFLPDFTDRAAVAQAPAKAAGDDPRPQVEQLQAQVKLLQGLVPDQAAVMSHVAYHFANLWFAIEQENWPLADFYLGETRNNVKWAVRSKPVRKNSAGQE